MSNRIRLRKRESVPPDFPDSTLIFADADGGLKQVDSEGTVTDIGSGSGGNVPFVGNDPPSSPTDGMLWWDPDDDTSVSGSQAFDRVDFTLTAAQVADRFDGDVGGAFVQVFALNEGDYILNAFVSENTLDQSADCGDLYYGEDGWTSEQVNDGGSAGLQPVVMGDVGTFSQQTSGGSPWAASDRAVVGCAAYQFVNAALGAPTTGQLTVTALIVRAAQ